MNSSLIKADTYIFAGTLEDAARLNMVNMLFNDLLGGVFPPHVSIVGCRRMLDLACGPGGWIFDVSESLGQSDPAISVVGIDNNPNMIELASGEAYRRGQSGSPLLGVEFHVMDVLKPLKFVDASFDYIHARLLSSFVPASSWPALLQECRPG